MSGRSWRTCEKGRPVSDSYELGSAALTDHARLLENLAADLRSAGQSAQVRMTGDAYGQAAERFATMIEEVAQAGRDTLAVGVDALESAGTALRDTARAYEQQESDAAASFGEVETGLGAGIGGDIA